ncbi:MULTISPECIES: glutamate synthase subunit beta [unclassified Microbacterium]|uniref:glutamate synthase subunit beta n=1 Tax=unclassified Microbacterium TaxID=2609290 RepID=UPI0006F49CC5|nr:MULTISPECIES: glutamate synthase subunit beta [unclassified Microbacterium]MBD8205327.1 glutamate synthase subunit beta [Microbacterium sp. CFBP 8801]MBD8477410.1 glutamate synthase subunit beta [Microbacterium sp. CFBP 8794]MBD8509618.1 glutamate synthase subunit beta [Microbacterium sp. CFBP 8790]AOX44656.1 glutamate synthase [Microbacterium sp. BH-3-3-3]KQR85078.1 glutamate synthase [Microbacterium sp. Leaf179]
MADPKGFLKTTERELPKRRPVPVRIMDWKEVYEPGDSAVIKRQAGRCMDCGIPFCHKGCPLGNLIPEWNDLTWRGEGRAAIERLHATNNFPEFTGRLCPAPCESSCVLGINQPAVTIKQVEVSIIDEAFSNGWVEPEPPERLTGKTVAVVGSGPAGLAAAQQLTRAGHTVAVFERDDRIGGLMRYGIPDFKMEKRHLELRLRQMQAEGTRFRAGVEIGKDISWSDLRARYDAVVVATGSTLPRDLAIPGRDLDGVHYAMEYLIEGNKAVAGDQVPQQISAEGKHVVVIGGGDTGADCIGTAHRQGALSVTNLAIGKQPPSERPENQPWPMMPNLFEMASAHEEGGERSFLASTVEFLGNAAGEVRALRVAETEYLDGRRVPKSGTEREIPADLVLIAMGFTGPESAHLSDQLGTRFTDRGNVERDATYATSTPGVFVAGDAGRGQSLIVWAIAEGRAAAAEVDTFLMGETVLPAPVRPTDVAIGLLPT